jgi:hypothetical protein
VSSSLTLLFEQCFSNALITLLVGVMELLVFFCDVFGASSISVPEARETIIELGYFLGISLISWRDPARGREGDWWLGGYHTRNVD